MNTSFEGFDLTRSVPTPNFFFDLVTKEHESVTRLVGSIIRHSVTEMDGKLTYHKWEVSPPDLMTLTGIDSRSTLSAALRRAREKGYIHVSRYADGERVLQLRRDDEPIYGERHIASSGEPSLGFVYFVKAANGLYKIGKSVNPASRLVSLSSGSPIDLQMYKTIGVDDMADAELRLHELFESRKVKGEWFRLHETDLNTIEDLGRFENGRWFFADGGERCC